jgi:MoaA/NifB/PqqE/SkfB family radical SAM enzyme
MFRTLERRREEWQAGVTHVTLNPKDPGVVRIHLVPPKPGLLPAPHLVFLNGWWVLPVSPSEARLIRYFVAELDKRFAAGQGVSDQDMSGILEAVTARMRHMYPRVDARRFSEDLLGLLDLFTAVAQGRELPPGRGERTLTLADYADRMRGPHRMDLIISPMILGREWLCPNHCPNCYALGQGAMRIEHELSTEQWKAIIDRCWEIGIPQLSFTGGEPTMRADLVDLITHAQRFVTRLNTSGVTMSPELATALYDASLDAVQITLYSADAETHDRLVGSPGAWQKSVAGIKNALAAGLYVSVNTPLTRANADFVSLLEFLHGLGVCYVSCSGLIPTGGAVRTIEDDKALKGDALYAVLEAAVAYARTAGIEMAFTSPGWLSAEQLERLGLEAPICGAGLSNMAVAPNGTVVPCQSWLADAAGLGDILNKPWKRIWADRTCVKIRRRAALKNACPLSNLQEVVQ